MATLKRTITEYRCDRCGHAWLPRRPHAPKVCPACKRREWNNGRRPGKEE